MIDLFTIPQTDQSIVYLKMIFGTVAGGSASITILGTLFKTFNSIILAVAALLLVYITVVGVLNTAAEGEAMGKQWSGLWTPLRTVIGIAALVPTGNGYSGLQILMMWVIMQGVGAADTLWGTGLAYIDTAGSVYAQLTLPSVNQTQEMRKLFQGLVCDATARMKLQDPTATGDSPGYYLCNQFPSVLPFCASGAAPHIDVNDPTNVLLLGPMTNTCGTLNYCDVTTSCPVTQNPEDMQSLKCLGCKAQRQALSRIVDTMYGVAQQFAAADYSYRKFSTNVYPSGVTGLTTRFSQTNTQEFQWIQNFCADKQIPATACCMMVSTPQVCQRTQFPAVNGDNATTTSSSDSGAVKTLFWKYWPQFQPLLKNTDILATSVQLYMDAMNGAYTSYIQAQGTSNKALGNSILQAARDKGWSFAGGFYNAVANVTKSSQTSLNPDLNFVQGQSWLTGGPRTNLAAATDLLDASHGGPTTAGSSNPATKEFGGLISSVSSSLNQTGSSINANGNPLYALQATGYALLMIAQVTMAAIVLVSIAVAAIGFIDVMVLGNWVRDPIGPMLQVLAIIIVPIIYGFLGLLTTLGGTLAIYIPLIPFTIFTFGVIAWFISTIEAMVAGPIVALGIISPGGNSQILGRAEPALMMLFSIFLRPSLMIFGLFASMLLSAAVVSMINSMFWGPVFNSLFDLANTAQNSSNGQSSGAGAAAAANILQFIIFLCAYVAFVFAALNKTFQIIAILPNRVMSWIGGHGEDTMSDATSAMGKVEGAVGSGGGKAMSATKSGQDMGSQTHATKMKTSEKNKEEAEGQGGSGTIKGGSNKGDGK